MNGKRVSPLLTLPHLRIGEATKAFPKSDDQYVQRWGIWMSATACGERVPTGQSTKNADAVRCPDCLAASPAPATQGGGDG